MLRTLLAPRWLALHALLVAAVVTCAVLGWWQWGAFRAESVVAPVEQAAPRPLGEVIAAGTPLDGRTAGQRVRVRGTYDAGQQLLVPGRELGGRTGVVVVTPLRTAGGVVAVRRGWVPLPTHAATAVPPGPVTVTGVLHPGEDRAEDATGGTSLPAGQIPLITATELHVALPYAPRDLYDGFLELSSQQPPAAPAPALLQSEPRFASGGVGRWQNLSYVGQWWIFGLAAVGFWVAFVRSAFRARREELEDAAYEERVRDRREDRRTDPLADQRLVGLGRDGAGVPRRESIWRRTAR